MQQMTPEQVAKRMIKTRGGRHHAIWWATAHYVANVSVDQKAADFWKRVSDELRREKKS